MGEIPKDPKLNVMTHQTTFYELKNFQRLQSITYARPASGITDLSGSRDRAPKLW